MENSRELEIRQQIDAYVKGQLSEDEIQDLWNEFAKNPHLLEVLEIESGLKSILEEENKPKKASINVLPSWTWHAAAAAVILIVALVQLFKVDTPTELNQFLVANIEPAQIETADALRADGVNLTEADSLLNLGFEALISGDEDRALELFETVINNHEEEPYGSKAYLNKGIILYNEGDYQEASTAFQESADRAENNRMISEKAYWYLGNALINIGELEEAREAVFEAYKIDGVFRTPAFRLLQKLNYDLGKYDYDDFDTQQLN
ncbi:MAG: tetratricopeptide repeat protein [Balneolaceae bacterium]